MTPPAVTDPGRPTVPVAAPTEPGRGMPLAARLGLVLGVTVLVVLLFAGVVVNRVVSQGFEDVVTEQQQQQVDAAAEAVSDVLRVGGGGLIQAQRILNNLSRSLDAPVIVLGPNGQEIGRFGPRVPPGDDEGEETHGLDAAVVVNGEEVATITAIVPERGGEAADRPFLRLFNLALLVAGLVSVAVIAGVSVWLARRQTRPLHDVADAAARLGAGDLTARATGGGDRESQELAGAFNTMAGRLEGSEMLRRRAASDMAHDLATPATVLQGQLQAMIDGVVPKSKANLEAASASAAALGSVIVQMGELASAEAAPLQARPERVEVGAALTEAASALDGLYRDKGVTLDVERADPDLAAWADPAHLGRALRNVLTNAAQHTPRGKSVLVAASLVPATLPEAPAHVAIRVIDQGPGIPAEDVPHIFERFYRSDPARTTGSGAGIGLTIARELLAASGGGIAVEKTDAEGTIIRITLQPAPPA
ncbi:MAG TPA: HAMP domain-containing sensor histidine kinase [Candidatus Limnocylindria bacterium]